MNDHIIIGAIAVVGLYGISSGDRILGDIAQQSVANEAHAEIEGESFTAAKALAAERMSSGLCLPTDRPIRPGMVAAVPIPTGTCLHDAQGVTALTDKHGNLTQLARAQQ